MALLVLFLLSILPLLPGFARSKKIEQATAKFFERRTRAIWVLFFSVILIRLLFLTTLRIPTPGIHDEMSYLLMGDTFAHGRLTNPPHPMWVSFETFHVNWIPTYCSKYPPAQGLVLAIGELLGHPWIGVLLSNAAMCAAVLWMLQAWLPARWAFLGAAIVAVQLCFATYWMNGYWGGAVAAIGGALVLGAFRRILRSGRVGDALWLGLGLAILANSRPLEGFVFCLPAFLYFLAWLAGNIKTRIAPGIRLKHVLLPLAACGALTVAFMGYYNWRLTGNALLLPYTLNMNTYGVAKTFIWRDPGPPRQYRNAQFDDFYNHWEREYYSASWADFKDVTLEKLDIFGTIFFWKGELLLLPAALFLFRDRRMRFLLLTFFLGAAGLFVVIWGQSHYAAPLVCVLAALVVQSMRHWNTFKLRGWRVGSMIVRLALATLAVQIGAAAVAGRCDPYQHHCEGLPQRAAIEKKLQTTAGRHLVMVRYDPDHDVHFEWVYNGAEIDGAKILWARDLDAAQNARLFDYFKDRQIWVVHPDDDDPQLEPYAPE